MLKNLLMNLLRSRRDPWALATAHATRAVALRNVHDLAGAERSCRSALALQDDVNHRLLLVDILEAANRRDEAIAELLLAQECAPGRFDILLRLFGALCDVGFFTEALRLAEHAVGERGENYDTLRMLAAARYGMADMAGAVEASRKALLCRPDQPAAHVTLGSAYFALGDVENALASYRQALEFKPGYPDALFHIGLIDLMLGRFRDGWVGFEQRFRRGRNRTVRACEPAWDGTPLHDRTLLVMREQGLGDEIMFASCYPDLINSAVHCHIECEPRLEKLFVRSFPGATFHPLRDVQTLLQTDPGCPVDVRSYAGSLPHLLRNAPGDFPRHQGYLRADPVRLDFWRARLAGLGAGLKVGLSWRGGTAFTHRERRTLSLEQLLPVLSVPGVRWVNLQYGKRADELAQLAGSHGIAVADWPEAIDGDYDETAALVGALDLVISACTSIVHLTGALGQPAWVMTAFVPEWRYGLHQESMPWYPSVRLFRQTAQGEWDPVVSSVEQALRNRVTASAAEAAYNRPAAMT